MRETDADLLDVAAALASLARGGKSLAGGEAPRAKGEAAAPHEAGLRRAVT